MIDSSRFTTKRLPPATADGAGAMYRLPKEHVETVFEWKLGSSGFAGNRVFTKKRKG